MHPRGQRVTVKTLTWRRYRMERCCWKGSGPRRRLQNNGAVSIPCRRWVSHWQLRIAELSAEIQLLRGKIASAVKLSAEEVQRVLGRESTLALEKDMAVTQIAQLNSKV